VRDQSRAMGSCPFPEYCVNVWDVKKMVCKRNTAVYTGCPRRNVPDFGRVFLMLKYTDVTQNTYVQS